MDGHREEDVQIRGVERRRVDGAELNVEG